MKSLPCCGINVAEESVFPLVLKEAFERGLREKRPYYFSQKSVLEAQQETGGEFEIAIGSAKGEQTVLSKGVILATGRFIGGGLSADRRHIRETIFDLPVHQPEKREQWHQEDFFDSAGRPHPEVLDQGLIGIIAQVHHPILGALAIVDKDLAAAQVQGCQL